VPANAVDGLGDDQVDAVTAITDGAYEVATVIGPAGAGKTTMLRAAADCYQQSERRVVVLALSAAAARVVTDETGLAASTIASWHVGGVELPRGGLVIVDEASMVPTLTLDRLVRVAQAYGSRVALIGDYAQMGAPEAGGLLRDLAALPGATNMTAVRRFREQWERDASKQLRDRDPSVAAVYAENGRLTAVETDTSTEVTVQAWLCDVLAGHDSLIVVDTASDANRVSVRCQELLAAHELIGRRVGAAPDGTPICVGGLDPNPPQHRRPGDQRR
jgi:ATP-dependent exoDNAse (exonuclease V) alpha subunit